MNGSPAERLRCWSFFALLICALQPGVSAEIIPVRHVEGTEHGFLALRTKEGRVLAVGDLYQVVRGGRVTSRLLFRFKDGSIDDETTVFTQRGSFQLITDHHIQKGPSFPQPMDLSIDVRSGMVVVRSTGKNGKEEVTTEHMDLPPDLVNGMVLSISKNILPKTPETKVSMVVATPKPRLVKVAISPQGEVPFSLVGSQRKAMRFVLKIELGGVAGVVAPLIGKAPPEIQIWIIGGRAPAFVREEGPLYQGGPVLTIQLTSPVWPDLPTPAFRIALV
ncbi:MAG: hypothetical protein JWM54_1662 [Acidobacteriaceae bacterium]|nr:hypothetical protein [Acidobacteriaceae bacterium]